MKQRIEVELFKEGDRFGFSEIGQGCRVKFPKMPFSVTFLDSREVAGLCTELKWENGVCKAVIELEKPLVGAGIIFDEDLELINIIVPRWK